MGAGTWMFEQQRRQADARRSGIGGLRGGFQQPQQMGQFNRHLTSLAPQMQQQMVDPRQAFHQQREQQHLAQLQMESARPRSDILQQFQGLRRTDHRPSLPQAGLLRPQQITGFPAPRPYGGGAGFAKPLSPNPGTPQQGGAGGAGGAPTSWKMSIEPMANGGMIPGYQNGGQVLLPYQMNTGGHVPMVYADGGWVPAYGIGGFFKGLGKLALKAAPIAVGAWNPLAGAGLGALISGIKDKSLKSALVGGATGYLGGKALSSGLKAAHLGSLSGSALEAAGEGSLRSGLGQLIKGKGLSQFGDAALGYLSDPKKVAMLYPMLAEASEQQAQENPENRIPSAYGAESQAVMPQSATPGYVAPAQGYTTPIRAEGGLISLPLPEYREGGRVRDKRSDRKRKEGKGRKSRRKPQQRRTRRVPQQKRTAPVAQRSAMVGREPGGPREGKRSSYQPAMTPVAPAVQPVAQQLQESGLVPLTPPPPPPPPAVMQPAVMPPPPPPAAMQPAVVPPPPPPAAIQPAVIPPPPPPAAMQPIDKFQDFAEEDMRGHGRAQREVFDERSGRPDVAEQIQDLVPQTAAAMPPEPAAIPTSVDVWGDPISLPQQIRDVAPQTAAAAPLPSGRNEGIGDEFVGRGPGKEDFEGFEPSQPQVLARPPVVSSPAYSPTPDYSPVDVWGNPIIDEDDVKGHDEDQAEELAFIRKEQRTNPAAGQAALREAAAREAARPPAQEVVQPDTATGVGVADPGLWAAADPYVDPAYRAGLMAETASATGDAPITGYDPFNMPTAGQASQFDPAYAGMMSRLGGQEELGAGPAPYGGFEPELVTTPDGPETPSDDPVIPDTDPEGLTIPVPEVDAEALTPKPQLPPPVLGKTPTSEPEPEPEPLAYGGPVDPYMMSPGSGITGDEEMPPEIRQVAIMALRGEMPAAQAAQLLDEIRKLFPAEIDELTNQIRVMAASEGGTDGLVREGFLPPYPDNGLQGNGEVDDTLAVGPMPTSGYQAGGSTSDFEQAFQERVAGGGPLPVRALLAGGEYIVNAGDAGAGRQELIDAATGIDPRTPPGAAVWDDFVGNINT